MAGNAYPHILFAADDTTLPKERLGEVVVEVLGRGDASVGPINVVVDLGGYALTFWYDDGADGLAEHYANFLPETARRRRLLACTTMIDASGDADPDRSHAADLTRVWDALAQQEGVWVFSEAAKRFVGLDYGEGLPEPVPAAEAGPTPVPAPGAPAGAPDRAPSETPARPPAQPPVPEPLPVERPAAEAPPSTPPEQAEEPAEPVPATPMPRVEPTAPPPAPMPTAEPAGEPVPMPTARPAPTPVRTPVPDQPAEPAAETDEASAAAQHRPDEEPQDTEGEKPGLLKRLFGRRK